VPVDVDVVVDGPVVPVAKIINKFPTAHVVFSPISPFTLTLIPHQGSGHVVGFSPTAGVSSSLHNTNRSFTYASPCL